MITLYFSFKYVHLHDDTLFLFLSIYTCMIIYIYIFFLYKFLFPVFFRGFNQGGTNSRRAIWRTNRKTQEYQEADSV